MGAPGDIYSLGVSLYALLCGESPYSGLGHSEIIRRVCDEEFPDITEMVHDLPSDVASIIRRCTQKRPEDRFQDGTELSAFLARISSEETTCLIDPNAGGPPTTDDRPPRAWLQGFLTTLNQQSVVLEPLSGPPSAPAWSVEVLAAEPRWQESEEDDEFDDFEFREIELDQHSLI